MARGQGVVKRRSAPKGASATDAAKRGHGKSTGRVLQFRGRPARAVALAAVGELRVLLLELDRGDLALDDFAFELQRVAARIGQLATRGELAS